jgi:hypothetical protein
MKLIDRGGKLRSQKSVEGELVHFRVNDNALTAFIDMPFRRGFEKLAIKHIVLGAKNPNWSANVLYFVGANSYQEVTLEKSHCV